MTVIQGRNIARQQIAAWATPETKDQFRALASSRGLSESKMLAVLIDSVLGSNPVDAEVENAVRGHDAKDRVSIRLRPGDGKLLRLRARERRMNYTTYAAALIRAHLRTNPPMPMHELAMLERGLSEITSISRALRRIATGLENRQRVDSDLGVNLDTVRHAIEDLRRALRDLVTANVISWESNDA